MLFGDADLVCVYLLRGGMVMMSLIVVTAIVVSIALGYRTKINTGFFAIAFAYIIGCFVLDIKASDVVKLWPASYCDREMPGGAGVVLDDVVSGVYANVVARVLL